MKSAGAIVTFEPDLGVAARVRNVARQVDVLYLIDNSASPSDFGTLPSNVRQIDNQNSGGLAGALNRALRLARAEEFGYLFVFDQDTDVEVDFCASLLTAAVGANAGNVAIFGPMHTNSSTGYPVRLSVPRGLLMSQWPTGNEDRIECMFLINSCSLLNLTLIGPDEEYDESLLVDMTDVDFCLRLRRRGLIATCVPSIQVKHGIGHRKAGSAMLSATHYSPHRKYLQARGRAAVWKRYASTFPHFVVSDASIAVMDFARTLVLEQDRRKKLKAYCRGFIDGLKLRSNS